MLYKPSRYSAKGEFANTIDSMETGANLELLVSYGSSPGAVDDG